MLSQQQGPTTLESISLRTGSLRGELQQSLESDMNPLSTAVVGQAEGAGSRRRIEEEEEEDDDKQDERRFLDLGVGRENTEGANGVGAFL